MVRISRNSVILNRIIRLRKVVETDTQKVRVKALAGLEELFDLASEMAKNEDLKLKQRQLWFRVAAYVAQIINSVATGFDERQMNAYLDEAERLVRAARAKGKAGEAEEGTGGAGADTTSQRPD